MTDILINFLCCMAGGIITVAMLIIAGAVRNAGGRRWKQ